MHCSKRYFDVCICPESGVIKTPPSNASIGAILHTMENELFETISTSFLVRTLPYAIITIKHAFLIHEHLLGTSGEVETPSFLQKNRISVKVKVVFIIILLGLS